MGNSDESSDSMATWGASQELHTPKFEVFIPSIVSLVLVILVMIVVNVMANYKFKAAVKEILTDFNGKSEYPYFNLRMFCSQSWN